MRSTASVAGLRTAIAVIALACWVSHAPPLGAQERSNRAPLNLDTSLQSAQPSSGQAAPDNLSSALSDASINDNSTPKEATIDLTVPDSPAFAVLGVSPATVINPNSLREFGISMLQGAAPDGTLQSGLALEFSPKLFFRENPNETISSYRNSYRLRLAERSQFSLATVKANDEDDNAMRVALGFHVTLWDKGDPILDQALMDCFSRREQPFHLRSTAITRTQLLAMRAAMLAGASDEEALEIQQQAAEDERKSLYAGIREAHQTCRTEATQRNEHASNLSLGIAQTWLSPAGGYSDMKPGGAAVWTSLAYGFDSGFLETEWLQKNATLVLHARYRADELAPEQGAGGVFLSQDTLLIALQGRVNGPVLGQGQGDGKSRLQLSLDVSYAEEKRDTGGNEYVMKYALAGEYLLQENTYLKLSIGSETGRNFESSEGFVLAALNWAMAQNTK